MSAPFELPDRVTLLSPDESSILYTDVPCRVVPCMTKQFVIWNSATDTQTAFISHWVDLDGPEDIVDPASLIAALHYRWEFDDGVVVKLEVGAFVLKLRIMWTELRYTNTENQYIRHYCSRLSLVGA